jgi:hypothetical protein
LSLANAEKVDVLDGVPRFLKPKIKIQSSKSGIKIRQGRNQTPDNLHDFKKMKFFQKSAKLFLKLEKAPFFTFVADKSTLTEECVGKIEV